ncbi:MAG: hypothetical protein JWL71_3885 [Acidobacteria bacterium]|jgi:hypothetical protein|nr:hypothetical protein [Acidobacteriota bacterium]
MTPVVWMVGAGLVSWLAATIGFGAGAMSATLYGMAGPLVVAITTWRLADQTYRRDPVALTGLMMAGFVAKMVFFGAYVAVVLTVLSQPAVPFAVSFTSAFIALHLIEALALRRLFAS